MRITATRVACKGNLLVASFFLACSLVQAAQEAKLPELPRNPTKAEDQYEMGRRLEQGLGMKANVKKAIEWYAKAAAQGHAAAQGRMGLAHEDGSVVQRDMEEAMKWYRLAAQQGHADTQNHLGFLYFVGRRVPHDDRQAEQWFRKAAEQGHPTAQSYLGMMLAEKSSLPAYYIQAHMWLQLSEAGGYGLATMQREDIERRMSTSQINEAKRLAEEWRAKRKASEKPPSEEPVVAGAGMAAR